MPASRWVTFRLSPGFLGFLGFLNWLSGLTGFVIVPAEATPLTNPHRNLPRQFAAGLLLILLSLSGLRSGRSQATPPSRHSASPDSAVHITLGQAVYPLYGPWKFRVGDSPLDPATQKPLWGEPGLDDSGWELIDLTPKEGSIDPISGLSGYVPGWTAKGHLGLLGVCVVSPPREGG